VQNQWGVAAAYFAGCVDTEDVGSADCDAARPVLHLAFGEVDLGLSYSPIVGQDLA
jgi:hypothetical protein